jgi:nitrate reductase gamma subunit
VRDDWLFGVLPYAAVVVAVVAPWLRYASRDDRSRRLDEDRARVRALLGGRAWRWAVAAVALGHGLVLLAPHVVLAWNEVPARLYVLEATLGVAGVAGLVGLVAPVRRHLTAPDGVGLSVLRDTVVLGLLLLAVASGLAAAALYRWGSSWGAVTLTPYMASLARLDAEVELIARMPFLVKLHVFSAFAFLAVAALTPLASIPARPVLRLWGRAWPPVRSRSLRLRAAAEAWVRRRRDALAVWPEEES